MNYTYFVNILKNVYVCDIKIFLKNSQMNKIKSLFEVCNLTFSLKNILIRTQNETIECKYSLLIIHLKKKTNLDKEY